MFFQNLTIAGGRATDVGGLVLPTGSGVGGGVLMDGGLVTMSKFHSTATRPSAPRADGLCGRVRHRRPGRPRPAGGIGQGGAIYLAAAT